jgi:hypothetical protein
VLVLKVCPVWCGVAWATYDNTAQLLEWTQVVRWRRSPASRFTCTSCSVAGVTENEKDRGVQRERVKGRKRWLTCGADIFLF